MEQQKADHIIIRYSKKIFGFATKKSFSYDEAEELSAQMVSEVYMALLHAETIANVEGYIWRICENVYARYVATAKKQTGVSIDGLEIPYYDEYDLGEKQEELARLRREIGFLSAMRRKIVFAFYYEGKSIRQIATAYGLSEGTVKWHLNKARNDLKEGFSMERKVGNLGISPVEAISYEHSGEVEEGAGATPEHFIGDKINLNIVYSVYEEEKSLEEIAEEMGMTPVYLEERVACLVDNGFLVETKGKYTTYVKFTPRKVSLELGENILKTKLRAADLLVEQYVPEVIRAMQDYDQVYIPGGNRDLFLSSVICYAILNKCTLHIEKNLNRYRIRPLKGGDYFASVTLPVEVSDPDYHFTLQPYPDCASCGPMTRISGKYPSVYAWSLDSTLDSRTGGFSNNLTSDYDALYEVITGDIADTKANTEKFERLRERKLITDDGQVNIIVINSDYKAFTDKLPAPKKQLLDEFAEYALEQAVQVAGQYPARMQDYVVWEFVNRFIGNDVAIYVLRKLYERGVLKAPAETEMSAANLLMFACSESENIQ